MLDAVLDTVELHGSADLIQSDAPRSRSSIGQALVSRNLCHSGVRKLASGELLWCEGDERKELYLIRSGALCQSRLLPDGRRIVLSFAYPGDVVGLGGDRHTADTHALQQTRLERVPATAFKRAIRDDAPLGRLIADELNQALAAAYNHVTVISRMSASERLASFLVTLSDRNARHGLSPLSVVLPMKRLDIADFLGLTIETVSRTFSALKAAGLIALDQCNIVIFRDIQKLRSMAAGEVEGL
jgi:CRP-like cAMP-binding protein